MLYMLRSLLDIASKNWVQAMLYMRYIYVATYIYIYILYVCVCVQYSGPVV